MVEHSIPALEVVLIFITIYLHNFFFFENCPKLRASKPNFGQTLICYFRPKVRFCNGHRNLFKKTVLSKYKQFWRLSIWIFDRVKL